MTQRAKNILSDLILGLQPGQSIQVKNVLRESGQVDRYSVIGYNNEEGIVFVVSPLDNTTVFEYFLHDLLSISSRIISIYKVYYPSQRIRKFFPN